jgi:hypothetical protein
MCPQAGKASCSSIILLQTGHVSYTTPLPLLAELAPAKRREYIAFVFAGVMAPLTSSRAAPYPMWSLFTVAQESLRHGRDQYKTTSDQTMPIQILKLAPISMKNETNFKSFYFNTWEGA